MAVQGGAKLKKTVTKESPPIGKVQSGPPPPKAKAKAPPPPKAAAPGKGKKKDDGPAKPMTEFQKRQAMLSGMF